MALILLCGTCLTNEAVASVLGSLADFAEAGSRDFAVNSSVLPDNVQVARYGRGRVKRTFRCFQNESRAEPWPQGSSRSAWHRAAQSVDERKGEGVVRVTEPPQVKPL